MLLWSGYTDYGCEDELLAYGPIRGPAYHTASLQELNRWGLDTLISFPCGDETTLEKLSDDSDDTSLPAEHVAVVRRVAGAFGMSAMAQDTELLARAVVATPCRALVEPEELSERAL